MSAALDTWAYLLMLGGFLDDEHFGRWIGAAPKYPYMLDAYTMELGFDVFNSDVAAFDAVTHLAHRLHHEGMPVDYVEVE